MKKWTTGFTLAQTLIVLAIVAALMALALPSLTSSSASVHAAVARGDMLGSVMASTRHALVAQRRVILCPSDDGNSCAHETTDWSKGWLAYIDQNNNRARDPGERIILSKPALQGEIRLISTKGRTQLVFQPRGDNAGSNVTFTLCHRRGSIPAKTLVLANSGRWRTSTPNPAATESCEDLAV